MSRGLHNWSFSDVKRFLRDHGFQLSHVEGSHYFYVGAYKNLARQVSVPFHGSKSIHPKTLKSIVTQSGIPIREWLNQ